MRSGLFLAAGLLLLAGSSILAKLFAEIYPKASTVATFAFIALWLIVTAFNMWVGVARAGYSTKEELPVFLLLFGVPALAALIKWKLW